MKGTAPCNSRLDLAAAARSAARVSFGAKRLRQRRIVAVLVRPPRMTHRPPETPRSFQGASTLVAFRSLYQGRYHPARAQTRGDVRRPKVITPPSRICA
jgi:hypothetical protein